MTRRAHPSGRFPLKRSGSLWGCAGVRMRGEQLSGAAQATGPPCEGPTALKHPSQTSFRPFERRSPRARWPVLEIWDIVEARGLRPRLLASSSARGVIQNRELTPFAEVFSSTTTAGTFSMKAQGAMAWEMVRYALGWNRARRSWIALWCSLKYPHACSSSLSCACHSALRSPAPKRSAIERRLVGHDVPGEKPYRIDSVVKPHDKWRRD